MKFAKELIRTLDKPYTTSTDLALDIIGIIGGIIATITWFCIMPW